jgi:hypothetical protein
MILILSNDADIHATMVREMIEARGERVQILDTGDFPARTRMVMEPGAAAGRRLMHTPKGTIDLSEVRAVWWRRPQPYGLHEDITDPVMEKFTLHEIDEAIEGLYLTLDADWLNIPTKDACAARKIWQLDVARDAGLKTPRTLITNDPGEARAFARAEGVTQTIYKPFQGLEEAWRETRLLKPEEMDQMDAVKYAPVIFQECIEAEADLRVTVVGDRIFPAAIDSTGAEYKVDFRMEKDMRITPTTLRPETEAGIRALMRRMGLSYGAIDFRRRPNGEEVFLEINPAGQWLFVEDATHQPITEAIADWLITAQNRAARPVPHLVTV